MTRCLACEESNNKRRQKKAQGGQVMQVRGYIAEIDILEGARLDYLIKKGYIPDCPECGEGLGMTSSGNLIVPREGNITRWGRVFGRDIVSDDPLVYFIGMRVKSTGELIKKMIDWIVYDESDPNQKRRSLADRFGAQIVLNYSAGQTDKQKITESFERRHKISIDDVVQQVFGSEEDLLQKARERGEQNPIIGFTDRLCYAHWAILLRNQRRRGFTVKNLQIKRKEVKSDFGKPEEFKQFQGHVEFGGYVLEQRLITRDVFIGEYDRSCGFNHFSFKEVEDQKRRSQVPKPLYPVLYGFFLKLFGNSLKDRSRSLFGSDTIKPKV